MERRTLEGAPSLIARLLPPTAGRPSPRRCRRRLSLDDDREFGIWPRRRSGGLNARRTSRSIYCRLFSSFFLSGSRSSSSSDNRCRDLTALLIRVLRAQNLMQRALAAKFDPSVVTRAANRYARNAHAHHARCRSSPLLAPPARHRRISSAHERMNVAYRRAAAATCKRLPIEKRQRAASMPNFSPRSPPPLPPAHRWIANEAAKNFKRARKRRRRSPLFFEFLARLKSARTRPTVCSPIDEVKNVRL